MKLVTSLLAAAAISVAVVRGARLRAGQGHRRYLDADEDVHPLDFRRRNDGEALQGSRLHPDLQFADDDIPNQLAQIENMVTKGAKVLVIGAIDGTNAFGHSRQGS